jgi:hypothetical protein
MNGNIFTIVNGEDERITFLILSLQATHRWVRAQIMTRHVRAIACSLCEGTTVNLEASTAHVLNEPISGYQGGSTV